MMFLGTALVLCAALVYGERDGYRDVSAATGFRTGNKVAEGEAFIAKLRERPRANLTPVEIQSEDMAEFALYRTDPGKQGRCIELLQKVHAAGPETIWGWAAVGFLDDFKALNKIQLPKLDPMLHLGEIGRGVLDFQPKRLEFPKGGNSAVGRAAKLKEEELSRLPAAGNLDVKTLTPGSVARRAILRVQLIEQCGEAKVDAILSAAGGEKLFARLWSDDATLEAFLLSGPAFNPVSAFETLMTFYLNDEDGWASTEEGRKITVASALNVRTAKPEEGFENRMRCYAAYRRLSQRKKFDDSTAKRDTREWRFIVRDPTSPSDVLYLNSQGFNPKRPGGVIYRIPYRLRNCFGESIFRHDAYFRPWRHSDWPYWYKVQRVGGVCNRQSTFGACLANAHGFMAQRAGQPNHCAWLMRDENRNWIIRNNINRYTAGVFMFWGRGYQYIQVEERAFADRDAWERSELCRFLARHVRAEKSATRLSGSLGDSRTAKLADRLLHRSISICPYNFSAWNDYTDALRAESADAKAWQKYLGVLVKAMPEGRTAAWDYAFAALNEMRKAGVGNDELRKSLLKTLRDLPVPGNWIHEEMNYMGVVIGPACALFKGDRETEFRILVTALYANWDRRGILMNVLSHGINAYAKDPEMSNRFLAAFGKVTDKRSDGGKRSDAKGLDFASLINSVSVQRQRDAFQTLAAIRDRFEPPPNGTAFPNRDFAAKLLSDTGILYTSGRAKGDAPQDYPRVIDTTPLAEKRSYQLAAEPVNSPWAVVELKGQCKISGVYVKGDHLVGTTVSVSEDGEEWKELFADSGSGGNEVRASFTQNRPRAKYIRVARKAGAASDPLKVAKILVYGDTLY